MLQDSTVQNTTVTTAIIVHEASRNKITKETLLVIKLGLHKVLKPRRWSNIAFGLERKSAAHWTIKWWRDSRISVGKYIMSEAFATRVPVGHIPDTHTKNPKKVLLVAMLYQTHHNNDWMWNNLIINGEVFFIARVLFMWLLIAINLLSSTTSLMLVECLTKCPNQL